MRHSRERETSAPITWTAWQTRDLVDSDVLTEHLRGTTAARDWLVGARQSSGLGILTSWPSVVQAEVVPPVAGPWIG